MMNLFSGLLDLTNRRKVNNFILKHSNKWRICSKYLDGSKLTNISSVVIINISRTQPRTPLNSFGNISLNFSFEYLPFLFGGRVCATVVLVAFGVGLAVALIDAGFVYVVDALFVYSDNSQGGVWKLIRHSSLGPTTRNLPRILNARG
jgi:hypothetical protein